MTTDKTKLLKMIENALQTAPPNEEAEAQAVIDATADWFYNLWVSHHPASQLC